jgi:hypothetical protein
MSSTNNSSSSSSSDIILDRLKCYVYGKQFDDMAEMQRHTLTEHIQKGVLPTEE